MGNVQIGLVMWVVYGYAIWILAEYLWDWGQQLRLRCKRKARLRRTEPSVEPSAEDEVKEIEPKPPTITKSPRGRHGSTAA